MIGFAMRLAPYGVAALIFAVTARFGFEILASLGLYVVVVLGGLALHQFGVLPLLARTAGVGPRELFRRPRGMMVTAFSTSSSNAAPDHDANRVGGVRAVEPSREPRR